MNGGTKKAYEDIKDISRRTNVSSVCFGEDNVGPFHGSYAEQLNGSRGYGGDGFTADPQKVSFEVTPVSTFISVI